MLTLPWLLLLLCGGIGAEFKFGKKLSITDPAFSTFFTPLSTVTAMNQIECAALALQTRTSTSKSARASAFMLYQSNSTCILGRSPTYIDAYSNNDIVQGDYGAFMLLDKPQASAVNSDTWFYALFNEEQSEYYSHTNFIDATPSGYTPSWSSLTYTLLSPVQSYNGQYAATFNGHTSLKFQSSNATSINNYTLLAWVNPSTSGSAGPVAGLCVTSTTFSTDFWVGIPSSTGGALYAAVSPDGGSTYATFNTAGGLVPQGKWSYVGLTVSMAAKQYSFWVNGTQYGPLPISASFSSLLPITQISVGQTCNPSYFSGAIASVEIYTRTMNQADVIAAMAKSYTRATTDKLPN